MDSDAVEQFWERVLSRDADQIRQACADLTSTEKTRLVGHLTEMVQGEGWHPEQRISAQAALDVLRGANFHPSSNS